jgi:hypothetical protein
MLPSTFGSSLWFSEEELAELEGTTLYRATVIQVRLCTLVLLDFYLGILGGYQEKIIISEEVDAVLI